MAGFVIEYDHNEFDPPTNKRIDKHYQLLPTGGRNECEQTVKNLKRNSNVKNIVVEDQLRA